MPFWKGSAASKSAKREAVVSVLQEVGLSVDNSGNVREGGLVIGSLTAETNFLYPLAHKHLPSVQVVQKVMQGMRRSTVSSENWKPNA